MVHYWAVRMVVLKVFCLVVSWDVLKAAPKVQKTVALKVVR